MSAARVDGRVGDEHGVIESGVVADTGGNAENDFADNDKSDVVADEDHEEAERDADDSDDEWPDAVVPPVCFTHEDETEEAHNVNNP